MPDKLRFNVHIFYDLIKPIFQGWYFSPCLYCFPALYSTITLFKILKSHPTKILDIISNIVSFQLAIVRCVLLSFFNAIVYMCILLSSLQCDYLHVCSCIHTNPASSISLTHLNHLALLKSSPTLHKRAPPDLSLTSSQPRPVSHSLSLLSF